MGPLLVAVNLVFAGLVALVVSRWRSARRALSPVDPAGTVTIRVRQRPWDPDAVERSVSHSLGATDFVPADGGVWARRAGGGARVAPRALGDRTTLVEVSVSQADATLAALVEAWLDEGYSVTAQRGRRVRLRRGPDRVVLEVDRA